MTRRSSHWDQRYLRLARRVASWSKDPSTRCGAVLVRPDNTIASVGFNGFARGMDDDAKLYADRTIKYPRVIHSEWNAILSCADPSLQDYTVYAWPIPPCDLCTAALVQKGVRRVVCLRPEADKLTRWKSQFEYAQGTWEQVQAVTDYVELEEGLLPLMHYQQASSWEDRFLGLAQEVASWSKDSIDPRGALLVRPDKTIASLGFNGFPQGVDDTPLIQGNLEVRAARMLEAEFNALLFAKDASLKGYAVYSWPDAPNIRGAVHLIQKGIRTVVHPVTSSKGISQDSRDAWMEVGATVRSLSMHPAL